MSKLSGRGVTIREFDAVDRYECIFRREREEIAVTSAAQNIRLEPEFELDRKIDADECSDLTGYKRSVAAVVNISGYLFQQGLSKTLETSIPDSKKESASQSEEKFTEDEPKLHKENVEMEFEKLKRENTELVTQMSVMTEELEKCRKRIEALQADLDESKVEVKRLRFKEEYKERELANLKRDFQSKERKWEEGNEHVEKVTAEVRDLWDDVDYLEESLKISQDRNEDLTFEVDELTIMMQEMKREYRMEHSRGGCGHLREEVELLNGSLELKEQRVVMLESQIDAFEAERKELLNNVDYLKESLKNSQERNEDLTFEVDELTIMMQEMKREYRMEHSRGGCGHLREEVELLNGSLELKEQRVVMLESQIDAFEAERKELLNNVDYLKESLKNSQERNEDLTFEVDELTIMMQEMKREYRMEHSRGGCGHLREEVELLNGSLELKEQRVVMLESQIDAFEAERKELLNNVDYLKESLKNSQERNEDLTFEVDELTIMMQEMKREYRMEHSRGGCGHLREEVELLNGSLELKEQRVVMLESQIDAFEAERKELLNNVDYLKESLKNSQERNEDLTFEVDELTIMMQEMRREYRMEHSGGGCGHLREEVELLNGSLELNAQRIVMLESQVDAFKSERSSFTNAAQSMKREMEFLNNEKAMTKTQLHELKRETSKNISDLQDEIAKLQEEKSTSSSEMPKESGKDNQLCEITCEKSWITRKLEDHMTRLRRENCSLTARVSKAYEKDVQLIELKEKVELNKYQLKSLTEAAKASLNSKEKEVEEAYRVIKKQDETIKNLIEEIRQERCDRGRLELQSEKIKELEAQVQRMEDIKRNTLHSEDALVLEVREERSEKEHLKKAVEAKKCSSHTAKELYMRIGHLENQLRKRDDLTNATLTSLKENKSSLKEANATIHLLTEQLEREKSDKETLRRALEVYESNSHTEKEKTEKIEKLEEQLQEMDDLREKTIMSLKEKERSLEEAHDEIKELTQQIAHEKSDKKYFKKKFKASEGIANRLNLVQKGTKRHTQKKGSITAHVGKRLKSLVHRQTEVIEKETNIGRVLDKLREDLIERGESMEGLRSNFHPSAKEFSSMRRQLEDSQFENADLKQRLGDQDDKVKTLEITIKKLKEDLHKTHEYLNEREAGLDDANETLQMKCSLLTTLGAKLCLKSKELTQANKDKGLEITRIETTLREVKKKLDIAVSIIEKQNEQCANLKTCAMRKTRDAEEIRDELKRLSTQLECARKEKENLQRALLTATVPLENRRFFAEKEQKALQVKVNSGLKELNTKSKQFWDMEMDLQDAAARVSVLGDEKPEQEGNIAAFKGKVSRNLDLSVEGQYVESEKESPLLLTIGSAEHEMAKLTRENHRQFGNELLHDRLENKSSESTSEVR